jgi:hypothetical protein
MTKELTGAAIITAAWTGKDGKEAQRRCVVPAHWLWSPEGLADMFRALRAGWLGEQRDADRDAWESFHILTMAESTDLLILEEKP